VYSESPCYTRKRLRATVRVMLTLEQCRKTDPRLSDLSDEEIATAREILYDLAELAIRDFLRNKAGFQPLNDGLLTRDSDSE
jgi:hypothetical protein